MGAVFNRVYDAAAWTGNKVEKAVDTAVDALGKIDTFDGLDKIGGVVQTGIALYILKNGSEGAEGLVKLNHNIKEYKDIYEGKRAVTTIKDFLVACKKLKRKSFIQIRADLCNLDNYPTSFRELIATTQKIAWPIITAITVNDLVGKFGGPSYNFVVTVFNGSTFVVGKVAEITAIPVKLVLLTYALCTIVIENCYKLVEAVKLREKTDNKIAFLDLPEDNCDKQERVKKLKEKITQRIEEVQGTEAATSIEVVKAATGIEVDSNSNDYLTNDYSTLMKQAAILKILNKKTEGEDSYKVKSSLESLKEMDSDKFLDKKREQYKRRINDMWNTVFKSSMEIVSTGIKVVALGTAIGNIYLGVQTICAIWRAENEWACKVLVERVKLAGAGVGLVK
ncbi:MAG: hypothetical protein ACXVAJ_07405, partial [Parachlamydiaceae bacterium]